MAHIAFTLAVCVVVIEDLVGSAKFVNEYVRVDVEISLYAVFQMVAAIGLLYMIITSIILRYRIRDIFEGLKNIYKASKLLLQWRKKNSQSNSYEMLIKIRWNLGEKEDWSHFLDEMNRKSDWIWKMFVIFGMGGFVLNNVMMSGASIVYCWMTYDDFDTNHLYTAYKIILTWKQTTKLGYFLEIISVFSFATRTFWEKKLTDVVFYSLCQLVFRDFRCIWCLHNGSVGLWYAVFGLYCIPFGFGMSFTFTRTKQKCAWNSNGVKKTYASFFLKNIINCRRFNTLTSTSQHLLAAIVSGSNLFLYCFFGKLATESFLSMGDWQN